MQTSLHVLIFGNDVSLLETRGLILARAGFLVEVAVSMAEVERAIAEQRPDVLLICHTISGDGCAQVERIATRCQPPVRTVALSSLISGSTARTGTRSSASDPLSLINTVQQVAGERAEELRLGSTL